MASEAEHRSYGYTDDVGGVRPAISLKAGTKIIYGGDGTTTNPYTVF